MNFNQSLKKAVERAIANDSANGYNYLIRTRETRNQIDRQKDRPATLPRGWSKSILNGNY